MLQGLTAVLLDDSKLFTYGNIRQSSAVSVTIGRVLLLNARGDRCLTDRKSLPISLH